MKQLFFVLILVFTFAIQSKSQIQDTSEFTQPIDKVSLGIGMGFDHGGFGGNILVYPLENIGIFAGSGYALAGLGVNVGAKLRFLSKKPNTKICPFIMGMYGYNSAIAVTDAEELNKLFYGPSLAFGFDSKKKPYKSGYWTIALTIPIRGSEVGDYMDDLEENHGVEFKNDLLPIGFSFGYRIILGNF